MKGERRYSIGAGIADFYVAGIVLGAFSGTYVAIMRQPVPLEWPLLIMALTVALIVVYYTLVARRVVFRTVGEVMMGRIVIDGRKQWSNPYGISRTALFCVLFIALVGAGNSWDSAADEHFFSMLTPQVVLGRAAVLACLLVGIVMIGRHYVGVLLIAAYFTLTGLVTLLATPPAGVPGNVTRGLGVFGLSMGLVAGALLSRYHKAATSERTEIMSATTSSGSPST